MTTTDPASVEVVATWPADVRSVREARTFVDHALRDWGMAGLADSCVLVVSELAGNSVVHARSAFTVTLSRLTDGLLLRVNDAGSPDDLSAGGEPAASDAPSGRGLDVVASLAVDWGVIEDGLGGKAVWALFAE
jgi:anti-sigma regulatory factor (Ser/Thr protein kinase)